MNKCQRIVSLIHVKNFWCLFYENLWTKVKLPWFFNDINNGVYKNISRARFSFEEFNEIPEMKNKGNEIGFKKKFFRQVLQFFERTMNSELEGSVAALFLCFQPFLKLS